MAKISRTRGATYEREVAQAILEVLGVQVKRNLAQYQEAGLGDLQLWNYVIECKRRRSIAVHAFMKQAEEACEEGQTPIVVMRADGEKSVAMMRLEDLLRLLQPPTSSEVIPARQDG